MALSTFERQLQFLRLLATNHNHYDIETLASELGLGRRQAYRYLALFRSVGFHFGQKGSVYHLLPSSPLCQDLTGALYLSDDEAALVHRLLTTLSNPGPQVRRIKSKLRQRFSDEVQSVHGIDEKAEHNLQLISQAISQGLCARLIRYASQNSSRCDDRLVEPFALLNGNAEVLCFEPESQMNKTFRLTRTADVELLDMPWHYTHLHRTRPTDYFGYSSDEPQTVVLRLSRRAKQLLCEEVPEAAESITAEGETYLLRTFYCHLFGIGRFVRGLPGDVTVVEGDELKLYLE